MSKKKKRNKKIRDKQPTMTLKELIDKGLVEEHYHLKEQRFVGGLTLPNKMNSWWKRID